MLKKKKKKNNKNDLGGEQRYSIRIQKRRTGGGIKENSLQKKKRGKADGERKDPNSNMKL